MKLEQYQSDVLEEALGVDEEGHYKYSIIVWSDIKKSAKSTIAAAVNLYRATFSEWGEFYVVANDLKQADSRVSHYIRRAIDLNTKMQKRYRQQGYRITTPSGSFIEAIPIDPSGEAGSNADQVTFSELWGANEGAKQRMWAEMTIPPAKHGKAFRWIESYAGFSEESDLLWSLYELGVKRGKKLWPGRLYPVTDGDPTELELFVNDEAGMLCLWNTQPRCPWQTSAYYAEEQMVMPVNEFARIHHNQWVTSTETFVPMEWWYSCYREEKDWPAFDSTRHPMIIALDAATSNDNFGLWMGCRHPTLPTDVLTVFSQRWRPGSATGKIDFMGTEENPGPERMLRKLIKERNIIMVTYDPYQLHDMATRLRNDRIVWMKEFSQGNDRLKADSQFRELIRDRRFWHRGEPDLTEHVGNANAKLDEQESKVRLVKRFEKGKIDLAVAASMGSYQLLRLNL